MGFARNTTGDQAFIAGFNGFKRPINLKFGPDGCAWVVDYAAVRDLGEGRSSCVRSRASRSPTVGRIERLFSTSRGAIAEWTEQIDFLSFWRDHSGPIAGTALGGDLRSLRMHRQC